MIQPEPEAFHDRMAQVAELYSLLLCCEEMLLYFFMKQIISCFSAAANGCYHSA